MCFRHGLVDLGLRWNVGAGCDLKFIAQGIVKEEARIVQYLIQTE